VKTIEIVLINCRSESVYQSDIHDTSQPYDFKETSSYSADLGLLAIRQRIALLAGVSGFDLKTNRGNTSPAFSNLAQVVFFAATWWLNDAQHVAQQPRDLATLSHPGTMHSFAAWLEPEPGAESFDCFGRLVFVGCFLFCFDIAITIHSDFPCCVEGRFHGLYDTVDPLKRGAIPATNFCGPKLSTRHQPIHCLAGDNQNLGCVIQRHSWYRRLHAHTLTDCHSMSSTVTDFATFHFDCDVRCRCVSPQHFESECVATVA
jgi:hypothetical protein